ncbi:MAG TPA: NAD(P)-dependent oxidoreductase [Chloroflexota bacterium]|nr:NAD(P)-dependent oxidoreductase [Chloroflexota bacterium]
MPLPDLHRSSTGSSAVDTRVGFIGLGQMGKWMALNLLKTGHQLTIYNRTAEKAQPHLEQGARWADTPAELAAESDVLFMSLLNTEVVEQVVFGPKGIAEGAHPGLVVVDLSTIAYMATLDIARRLGERGIRFADAPVSGMEARAKAGTLTIMVGADEALFSEIEPLFKAIGTTILHMGPVGAGQLTKLINQLLFNTVMASMAEILPMAVKLGLDPVKVAQVAATGTGRSYGVEFFAPLILEGRFDQGYPIKDAYKDMISAAEISAQQKIPLPMVQTATTTFQMALAEGHGDLDKGGLIKVFERILNVQFRRQG